MMNEKIAKVNDLFEQLMAAMEDITEFKYNISIQTFSDRKFDDERNHMHEGFVKSMNNHGMEAKNEMN